MKRGRLDLLKGSRRPRVAFTAPEAPRRIETHATAIEAEPVSPSKPFYTRATITPKPMVYDAETGRLTDLVDLTTISESEAQAVVELIENGLCFDLASDYAREFAFTDRREAEIKIEIEASKMKLVGESR